MHPAVPQRGPADEDAHDLPGFCARNQAGVVAGVQLVGLEHGGLGFMPVGAAGEGQ
jgi:hypothetical protein